MGNGSRKYHQFDGLFLPLDMTSAFIRKINKRIMILINVKWDRRFLDIALTISKWSKDPSTQVGAVIVSNRHILATGYNGFPRGVDDTMDRLNERVSKLMFTVHAEANALAQCAMHGKRTDGATIYVTHPPCAGCMRMLIAAGIARVVFPALDDAFAERWATELKAAFDMASEAGVTVHSIVPPKWDAAATDACR